MKNLFLFLAFSALSLTGFAQTDFIPRKVGHVWYLNVPEYMSYTTELNSNASLQYMNGAREAYVIVIEDSKKELEAVKMSFTGAKDFLNNFTKKYHEDDDTRKIGRVSESKSDKGYEMAQCEMTYTSNGTKIWMLVTVIETDGYYYKILAWSLPEKKDDLKDDYLKMVRSLREE